ncbi:glycoside hydrolase family 135 protein [Periconia macrospinosa]|uniref:Glycoside hydrolase family 135 protein n=1 Tax=Periconia macrospinosa TaxID=97972 RepID=A0A2V1D9G7_9PLEO|nr:glycoside hydrolase family 135 protein [Periconia macrospinosa]
MTVAASKVLLPLYIYPAPGKWDPLFKAIKAYPHLEFIVIPNPHSGPGSESWWPNADYVREIPRLNEYENVRTVGYVATTYCKRDIDDIFRDIDRYTEWSRDERFPGLGVSGIFFDATPNLYDEEVKSYLDAVTAKGKGTEGFWGIGRYGESKIIIHNPGTAVQKGLAEPGPDITTSAEVAYRFFRSDEFQNWLAFSPYGREHTSYMIHSVEEENVGEVVRSVRDRAQYLFVTDSKVNFYHGFSTTWESFVAAMTSAPECV